MLPFKHLINLSRVFRLGLPILLLSIHILLWATVSNSSDILYLYLYQINTEFSLPDIQSSSEPEVLSSNKDKINLRNHLLRTNTAGHGAGDHSSYVQLAHFGKQKPLVRLAANCSYITKCKFDNSGARFGAVGFPEKAIIWKFDAYIQSMDPLVDYRVKITSPKDLLFIESSSIVSIAGDFGSNDNNAVICDFLLPKTRCVVKGIS